MQPSACAPLESSNIVFSSLPPPRPPALTAHLNPHVLKVMVTTFMAPCPSSSDDEKHFCRANAAQFKLMCGQKASVAMILAQATLPAAVLTSSAGRTDRRPTKEKLRHRQPVCNFLEIGRTRSFAYRSALPVFPLR